ncbi:LemA family protein [Flavisolibacter ginsenosidimutans]|uniref:LemA family protein n=1 Tax=Flavisolibacter ginsenosidimutans TaxID=661481 RepID=A0A5B8UNL5_9BACT|nr:LemA family protein [Flavisolibacter ginsenosidimutans]QEC58188.1 LemA family protein [Flavisolibacter ginsenosidimutans]
MRRSGVGLWIVLGIIVILVFWGCSQQRGLATADTVVQQSWSNVETNYQRRTDLYNSVVKTIQGSANFEKGTLTEVINARARATSVHVDLNDSTTLRQYQQAQAQLQGSFSRLMAVAEAYPDLKTTQAFQNFQTQIEGTENRINTARRDYNDAVTNYNLKVRLFPNNIFAGILGYHQRPFYKADPGSEKAPDINFDIK